MYPFGSVEQESARCRNLFKFLTTSHFARICIFSLRRQCEGSQSFFQPYHRFDLENLVHACLFSDFLIFISRPVLLEPYKLDRRKFNYFQVLIQTKYRWLSLSRTRKELENFLEIEGVRDRERKIGCSLHKGTKTLVRDKLYFFSSTILHLPCKDIFMTFNQI